MIVQQIVHIEYLPPYMFNDSMIHHSICWRYHDQTVDKVPQEVSTGDRLGDLSLWQLQSGEFRDPLPTQGPWAVFHNS